jgi:predicted HicB family RNase H-like nuclease
MTEKKNVKQKSFILRLSIEMHTLLKVKSSENQMSMKEFIELAIMEKVNNGISTDSI